MTDKTCGTCSHSLSSIVYCETNNPNANTAGLHGAGEDGNDTGVSVLENELYRITVERK